MHRIRSAIWRFVCTSSRAIPLPRSNYSAPRSFEQNRDHAAQINPFRRMEGRKRFDPSRRPVAKSKMARAAGPGKGSYFYEAKCARRSIYIDRVVEGTYTTRCVVGAGRRAVVAFLRRKGNTLLPGAQRAPAGKSAAVASGAARRTAADHRRRGPHRFRGSPLPRTGLVAPARAGEQPGRAIRLRSPYVQNLMHSLRNLNLDLADLSPPMLVLTDRANSSRELVTQLRLLRSTVDVKLDQFERSAPGSLESGRKYR